MFFPIGKRYLFCDLGNNRLCFLETQHKFGSCDHLIGWHLIHLYVAEVRQAAKLMLSVPFDMKTYTSLHNTFLGTDSVSTGK